MSERLSPSRGGEGDPRPRRPRPPPSRRRDKPQLSCNLCRRRKLRCDRQHPCSTCNKRGLGHSCTYAGSSTSSTPAAGAHVQDRLRHLENLVVSYMNQGEGAPGLSTPEEPLLSQQGTEISPPLPDVGSLQSSGTETKYQDQTHWHSILDAISELREDFGESECRSQSDMASDVPLLSPSVSLDTPLLYGCKRCSKEDILAALPPREFADRLVSECFDVFELSSCAVHKSGFLKQYASFWKNPQSVPVMWLGLLFSIFSMAINVRESESDQFQYSAQFDYTSLGSTYREKTAQCLFLGQYTRCGPFVIETLLHHFAAEYTRRRDINNEAWLILSTTVHLAMRMGFHKDPDHFKSISPYEGELRRRLWAMICHLGSIDITISGQLGVPRLINDAFADTTEPRNLLDSDLSPNLVELPPSRPESEITPMLMVLSRLHAGRMYTAVTNIVTGSHPPTYTKVLQVDRQIEEMYFKIPEYCRTTPQASSVAEPGQLLLHRLSIQMSYQRAQIILHWQYLPLAKRDDRYSYSTKVTVSAALKIIDLYHVIFEGLKTGGRLYSMRWRVSSFFNHDLLIALSILCFSIRQNSNKAGTPELDNLKQALRRTRIVWKSRPSMPTDLQRGFAAIESALPDVFDKDDVDGPSTSSGLTPTGSLESNPPLPADQDVFAGSGMPFFGTMFEGPPMFQGTSLFPSHMSDMEAFIDSVLAGSVDPWPEMTASTQYPADTVDEAKWNFL
ncbi:hypothetical protein F5Y17DRAFT_468869 [Xylariaceae sp. FL0594]|nr:hypothetical protein F5Y17DRAFT_468869 [Xylariaceae sp. FL0594]